MKQKIVLIAFLILASLAIYSQVFKNYYSSWDVKRPYRAHTYYIILHMTEGNDKSSLNTVYKDGTCHYLVATDGTIYRIISKGKIAKHAGRSMWNNRSNLSNLSIGIEVVGRHNKAPTDKQMAALEILIRDLQRIYKLGDDKVLSHSQVAYGSPNKWFRFNHRGRKRCGMLFAKKLRDDLGLDNVFTVDPDVKAGRLKSADPYLESIQYSLPLIAPPDEKGIKGITETEKDDEEGFEGFRELGKDNAWTVAGAEYNKSSTIYFLPGGKIRTGAELPPATLDTLPKETKVLVGYVYGGKVKAEDKKNKKPSRTPYSVVGKKWNYPSTYYRLPDGTVKPGDEIDDSSLPPETIILFRK